MFNEEKRCNQNQTQDRQMKKYNYHLNVLFMEELQLSLLFFMVLLADKSSVTLFDLCC